MTLDKMGGMVCPVDMQAKTDFERMPRRKRHYRDD